MSEELPIEPENQPAERMSQEQCIEWARRALREGDAPDELLNQLVESGWPSDQARRIMFAATVARVEYRDTSGQRADARGSNAAKMKMLFGGIMFVFGAGATILSYSYASSTGGVYWIVYGPVIAGLIQFFRGWSELQDPNIAIGQQPVYGRPRSRYLRPKSAEEIRRRYRS